jgi:FAD/FMN-containing dehydrogenase
METTFLSTHGITPETWTAFRLRAKGEVILPGDPGYDDALVIHNTRFEKKPAVFVKVQDAADVSRAVTFAKAHGLAIGVRAGGHGLNGQALVDGGLVIDMRDFKELRIDAGARTAWAQPGLTAGEYADAVHEYGLATPFGDAASVGLGGITLGGGIGYLARKYGLTIDNLLAAEVVTADGRIVQASETENPDLFWGLRGGGGNFGVVTGFQYRLVEAGTVYGGMLLLPATADVVRRYTELALEAPDELTTIGEVFVVPAVPDFPEGAWGTVGLGIFAVFIGDEAAGEQAMAPFRTLAEPIADFVAAMPYPAIYEYAREAEKPARGQVRSAFYDAIDDSVIEAVLKASPTAPSPAGFFQIRPLGGEMARVPLEATAFSNRRANFLVTIIDLWGDAAEDDLNVDWVEHAWDAIKGTRRGAYSNFLQDDAEERLGEAYAARTLDRLAEIKREFDPANFFNSNVNIAPRKVSAAA